MKILYSKTSFNYLKRQSKEIQTKIFESIEKLPEEGDIKKMKGKKIKNLYRLRVGKFRIIFTLDKEIIRVIDINTRGDIY